MPESASQAEGGAASVEFSEFESLLNKALAIDVDAHPEIRLSNTVMQRRAKWLLARKDDLILPELPPADSAVPAAATPTPAAPAP